MGEADFNHFMRLRNQLVIEEKNFGREEILSPVLKPTMSKHEDEQLKMAHMVVDILDRPYRKVCVILLRYIVHKRESCYAENRTFARKKDDKSFQQFVCVNFELDFIYPLDVLKSVNDKLFTNQHICNVLDSINLFFVIFLSCRVKLR